MQRRTFLRDSTGTNLVETALVMPLILLLTFTIIDFAAVAFVFLTLEHGVSQATRYSITGNQLDDPDNPDEQLSREESVKSMMRSSTPTLTLEDDAFTFRHMPDGEDDWSAGIGGPGDLAKVTVQYSWPILTPLVRPFFDGGQIALTVESAMKNEGRFE
jgi:hypothetical protein